MELYTTLLTGGGRARGEGGGETYQAKRGNKLLQSPNRAGKTIGAKFLVTINRPLNRLANKFGSGKH